MEGREDVHWATEARVLSEGPFGLIGEVRRGVQQCDSSRAQPSYDANVDLYRASHM